MLVKQMVTRDCEMFRTRPGTGTDQVSQTTQAPGIAIWSPSSIKPEGVRYGHQLKQAGGRNASPIKCSRPFSEENRSVRVPTVVLIGTILAYASYIKLLSTKTFLKYRNRAIIMMLINVTYRRVVERAPFEPATAPPSHKCGNHFALRCIGTY